MFSPKRVDKCARREKQKKKNPKKNLISKSERGHHGRCGEHQETGVDAWVGEKKFGIADGNGV